MSGSAARDSSPHDPATAPAPAPQLPTVGVATGDRDAGIATFDDRFDAALSRWDRALSDVITLATDPSLQTVSGPALMDWAQRIQRLSNRSPIAGQQLINAMSAAGCQTDSPLGLYGSMARFLSELLNIGFAEARRRVLVAEAVAPVMEMSGHRKPVRYQLLAEAQATGRAAPSELYEAVKAMNAWQRLEPSVEEITEERLTGAERILAGNLTALSGTDLDKVIVHLGDHLNPDGMHHDPAAQEAARSLTLRKVRRGIRSGTWRVEGYLTDPSGQAAQAVLNPLTRPQHVLDDGGRVVEPDTRSREERTHDAFTEVVNRALRSADVPAHGGLPASLMLTVSESDYRRGTGVGRHEDGTPVPTETVREATDEAEVTRIVLDDVTEEPLRLQRTVRIASAAQTRALQVRDGGCTFPGCDRSPRWCQRHHLVAWADGGNTDLDNLALLCSFHHHRFARHGWTAELRAGRVHWRPPAIIDPEQRPLINTAHRAPAAVVGPGPPPTPAISAVQPGPPGCTEPIRSAASGGPGTVRISAPSNLRPDVVAAGPAP